MAKALFFGGNSGEVPDTKAWKTYRKKTIVPMQQINQPFKAMSREGLLTGKPGDFLAEDGHGGYYIVSKQFHEKNYESA
jgi:hypothetical protein